MPFAGVHLHQIAHLVGLAAAGQMHDLCDGQYVFGRRGHRPVEADRTQRTAGHQHKRALRINAELLGCALTCLFTIGFEFGGQLGDDGAQWQADPFDGSLLADFQPRRLVYGADKIGIPGTQFVGHASAGVLFMDHHGDAHRMRHGICRRRRIAAESDDHIGLATFQNRTRLGAFPTPACRELERRLVKPPGERHLFYGVELIARGWNKILLQANLGSKRTYLGLRIKPDNGVGYSKQRVDMTGGPTARKNNLFHNLRA